MSPKIWNASNIRELARARLRKSESRDAAKLPFGKPGDKLPPESSANPVELSWGPFEKSQAERVLVVIPPDAQDGGEEIELLCATLGLRTIRKISLADHKRINPATFVGSGTLEKLRDQLRDLDCQSLVVDAPLSPAQVRNIEDILKAPVLDRQGIILGIFRHHAKSRLAQLQVELAQLKYLQPRLAGMWMGLSRQRGGRGGLGGRGLGESRLELDRRVVKRRISTLSKKLVEAERSFSVQAARRAQLPRVALVGYTNAGKSSLMQRLTQSEVLTENKLFSTLDTTVRPLLPPTEPKILISDTVGFVRNLPHELVASFKSTLREACESQLILHVLDISHERWREQFLTTEEVLGEIGALEIPRLLVLNKVDRYGAGFRLKLSEVRRYLQNFPLYAQLVSASARTGEGLVELRNQILSALSAGAPAYLKSSAPLMIAEG